MNPFAILGLPPSADVDVDDLETRYLALSRDYHPDFNQGLADDEQLAMLTRSAELNDAYRSLKNPWTRCQAMVEILDPEAMDATKTLCPMFLMEAMETREAVADSSADDWPRLRDEVQERVDQYFHDVGSHLGAGELREAATLLHQSNYYRKALRDLLDRIHVA